MLPDGESPGLWLAPALAQPRPDGDRLERVGDLLSEDGIIVVDVSRSIVRRAARVRAQTKIALADAIIIATAIETRCDAIVTNDRAWSKLTDIPVIDLDATVKASAR